MSSTPSSLLSPLPSVVLPLQFSLPRLPLRLRRQWHGRVNGTNTSTLPRFLRRLCIMSELRGYPPRRKPLILGGFSYPMSQKPLRALLQMPIGVKVLNLTLGRRIATLMPPPLVTLHTSPPLTA